MRALLKLSWLEFKIFAREPLGLIGSLILPTVIVVGIGRTMGGASTSPRVTDFVAIDLPVFAALTASVNAVLSLVTIVSIYREGGILKRLRATPLRPAAILSAHVLVKIAMTLGTLLVMMAAGRRVLPFHFDLHTLSFLAAAVISMASIVAIGFLIASVVPTARFAQPIGGLVLYPMLILSGVFFPVSTLPAWLNAVVHALPFLYAVPLLKGIWIGDPWSAHLLDIGALVLFAAVLTGLASRFFRWE
jgi:ABC-2 type transport system permease protein